MAIRGLLTMYCCLVGFGTAQPPPPTTPGFAVVGVETTAAATTTTTTTTTTAAATTIATLQGTVDNEKWPQDLANILHVQFYGEAQCPYCRKFVREAWPDVWNDEALMAYIEYDFVSWGNAYVSTNECGSGPYNPQQRACWYDKCITKSADNGDDDEKECFGGKVVYQHSEKEGLVDVFESCVKEMAGIEAAVDFIYCCEGPAMEDDAFPSALDLMRHCFDSIPVTTTTTTPVTVEEIAHCGMDPDSRHRMEVRAAKQTPVHPGVPYVLIDGEPLDDPFAVKDVLCTRLEALGIPVPSSCGGGGGNDVAMDRRPRPSEGSTTRISY